MVIAQISFYSKYDKFTHTTVTIGKGMPFILTGLGSKDHQGKYELVYIWTVKKGLYPAISGVSEDGSTVYFVSPTEPTEIDIELKVTDPITKETATDSINIDVLDVLPS